MGGIVEFFFLETLYPWEAIKFKRYSVALQMRGSVALHRSKSSTY
jgi:hypothetical protein